MFVRFAVNPELQNDDIQIGKCEGCNQIVYDINNMKEDFKIKMKDYDIKSVPTTIIEMVPTILYVILGNTVSVIPAGLGKPQTGSRFSGYIQILKLFSKISVHSKPEG